MLTTFLDLCENSCFTLLDVKLTCFQTCFLQFRDKHLRMCLWKVAVFIATDTRNLLIILCE